MSVPAGEPRNPAEETSLQRLMREAREDPQFFYDLVWNTESAISRIDYLSDAQKEAVLSVQPEDLVVGLAAAPIRQVVEIRHVEGEEFCGASCGVSCGGSCSATCGASCGGSCGASCDGSCAGSCGGSCGATCGTSCGSSCITSCVVSGDRAGVEDLLTLPAQDALMRTIRLEITAVQRGKTYTRFRR
jgi:hypothetical protein